jgi:hemerythrin-like metal-binding protein
MNTLPEKYHKAFANFTGGAGLSSMLIFHNPLALLIGLSALAVALHIAYSCYIAKTKRHGSKSPSGLIGLKWRESFESGNTVIDVQHRAIFDRCNKILYVILEDKPKAELGMMLQTLRAELRTNFKTEESMLMGLGHPMLEQHTKEHRTLLDKADKLIDLYRQDSLDAGKMYRFIMHDLIATHIGKEDAIFLIEEHITITSYGYGAHLVTQF